MRTGRAGLVGEPVPNLDQAGAGLRRNMRNYGRMYPNRAPALAVMSNSLMKSVR